MGEVQLFLVRVWQRVGLFRATVQPTDGGQARLFDRAEAVTDYLAHSARRDNPDLAPAGTDPAADPVRTVDEATQGD